MQQEKILETKLDLKLFSFKGKYKFIKIDL